MAVMKKSIWLVLFAWVTAAGGACSSGIKYKVDDAALDNVSDVMRLSTDIRYQRAEEPIDARWQRDWHDRETRRKDPAD